MKDLIAALRVDTPLPPEQARLFHLESKKQALPVVITTLLLFALTQTVLLAYSRFGLTTQAPPVDGGTEQLASMASAGLLWLTAIALYLGRQKFNLLLPLAPFAAATIASCLTLYAGSFPGIPIEHVHLSVLTMIPFGAVFLRLPTAWSVAFGAIVYIAAIAAVVVRQTGLAEVAIFGTAMLILSLLAARHQEQGFRRQFAERTGLSAHLEEHRQAIFDAKVALKAAEAQAEANREKYQVAQKAARDQYERRTLELERANREISKARQAEDDAFAAYRDVQQAALLQTEARARQAEQANASKTTFLERVSHDLRQPMSAIAMRVETTRIHLQNGNYHQVCELFPEIAKSVNTLTKTFGDLLNISKIESGKEAPEMGPVNVHALLAELEQSLRPHAETKGIQLRFRNLVKAPFHVHSNQAWLWRILLNLASNAIKFTPAKDQHSGVLVGAICCEDKIRVDVYDTGIGIDPKDVERIWEPFYKVGRIIDDTEYSSGLGLAIVRAAATALNHPLEFRSTVGAGSRFSIHIPLSAEQPTVDLLSLQFGTYVNLKGKTALIVEDEAPVRSALLAMLQACGVHATALGGVAEVRDWLRSTDDRPDFIVTDYRLEPDLNGGDLVVALTRKHFQAIVPTVVVTGNFQLPLDKFASLKAVKVLRKPVDPKALYEILRELIAIAVDATP